MDVSVVESVAVSVTGRKRAGRLKPPYGDVGGCNVCGEEALFPPFFPSASTQKFVKALFLRATALLLCGRLKDFFPPSH